MINPKTRSEGNKIFSNKVLSFLLISLKTIGAAKPKEAKPN